MFRRTAIRRAFMKSEYRAAATIDNIFSIRFIWEEERT